jgi:NAD(P)-dependent dehydrogenase (short-subunit alcohol dehydrogenase family)
MIDLSTFPKSFNVAIIGASGGIGNAFAQQLDGHDHVGQVYRFSRSVPGHIKMDISDEQTIQSAASYVDKPLHLVIVASGLLHGKDLMPEKSLRDLNAENMRKVMEVNMIGPSLVAKHFLPLFSREGKSIFTALSARAGSISDNQLGGWYSYRAAKAALNMMLKNTAIEAARKYKDMAVIGLHPGTVNTDLFAPYKANVKEDMLFSPEQAAQHLLTVLNYVNSSNTGRIYAWDGEELLP